LVDGWLDAVIAYGKPSQWIGRWGYTGLDWASGERKAETISFFRFMTRAGRAGLLTNEVKSPFTTPIFHIQMPALSIRVVSGCCYVCQSTEISPKP